MPQVESLDIIYRPGDNTGVGTTAGTLSRNGFTANSPTKHMQDANVLHDKMVINQLVQSTIVDCYVFFCTEGTWRVNAATYMSQVAGTGGAATLDVKVCGAGVAPSAGVTQLDAAFDLVTAAQAVDRSVIIASPTDIGPGSSVALDLTGTPTSVVGLVTIELKRIR